MCNYYIVRGWGGGRGRGLNYHSRYKGSLCVSPDSDTGSRKVLTPRKVPGRRASIATVVDQDPHLFWSTGFGFHV
jgi:hypothetical protein